MTAADGTRLGLTTYLPESPGDGPFPVVLETGPYRKDDDCFARDWSTFTYLAQRGIAGVKLDIRGTGASGGIATDEYSQQELDDALEVLAWIAVQDWSNGRVGMWGISWGGFSALQTAMLRPPELKAICAIHATHDRFACDVHFVGGSLHIGETVDWPAGMVALNALPPDPDIVGGGWYDSWLDRLEQTPQWLPTWMRHQHRDDYWLHASPCADYSSIQVPTLLIGGWLDPYVDGILDLAEHLDAPTRTIVGPWGHSRPATGEPGPTFDHLDLMARWFGHHLRDDDNGVMDMPVATLFVRDLPPYDRYVVAGHWREEAAWPPAETTMLSLSLADLGHDRTRWEGPQWVGAQAPFWDRGGWTTGPDMGNSETVAFESDPFDEALEILGTPVVEATVTVDESAGLVAARLSLVDPEGNAHFVSRGSRNLAFASGLSTPRPVASGVPMTVRFPLRATSAVIPAGWRIRLAMSGADFPIVWPPGERVALTIDPANSRVILPIVPPGERVATMAPGDTSVIAAPVETLEKAEEWDLVITDGRARFQRLSVTSELQPERDGLFYDNRQCIEISVTEHDPSTVHASAQVDAALRRPGWDVATAGRVEVTGDATFFRLRVNLTARLNGEDVWSRTWHDMIPREWA